MVISRVVSSTDALRVPGHANNTRKEEVPAYSPNKGDQALAEKAILFNG